MNYLKQLKRVPVKLRSAETLSYAQRVLDNGGTISEGSVDAIEKFVQDCKGNGIWAKLLEVAPFAGGNLNAALVKLVYPAGIAGVITNVNFVSGDYVETGASGGLNGDGLTKYLNTGWNAQTHLTDAAHFSFYLRDDLSGASGNRACLGALSGGDHYWLGALTPASAGSFRFGGTITAASGEPFNKGFYLGSRINTTDSRIYKNGVLMETKTNAVTHARPNLGLYAFAFNNAGAAGALLPGRGSFYSIGQALSDAEAASLNEAVVTLQRNLNRAV